MGVPKSQSQVFYLDLFDKLFEDLAVRHPDLSKSLSRDFVTLQSRFLTEGISFLTKTLPRLGKLFDRALDIGRLEATPSFRKMKGSQTIPAFLQGMFSLLFDNEGYLVGDRPDIVIDIRQVLYLVYKLELPYSPDDERRVIESFIQNEEELKQLDLASVDLTAERGLVGRVLEGFDPHDIIPKHGPGAVATGEKLESKWRFSRKYRDIHRVYPYYKFFIAGGPSELIDRIKWYRSLSDESRGVARVVLVPKDSRGPRLISCEPLEYQWIQQGLNRALVHHLENVSSLTKGQVNFKDQSVNQQLARDSSRHHYFSTIDLKDASDRVSCQLVRRLFSEEMTRCLMAVRSHATTLPDGREVTLEKYAPMGSAVCFSVEALVFWVICVVSVARRLGWNYRDAAQNVFVYGDDLIVPTVAHDSVIAALERCGLLVNHAKCCSNGDFRESCGVDAFRGIDVTPTRVSTCWSPNPSSGDCFSSYASYANHFARKGYDQLAIHIRFLLRKSFGVLPFGTDHSGYPCVIVPSASSAVRLNCQSGVKYRWNSRLQRYEFRVKTLVPKRTKSSLVSWPRLLRNLVSGPGERPEEVVHPRSTVIRWRWVSVYGI